MDTLIEVKNISYYYAQQCAVNNISFSLQRGEVLGFLGPNGAGKSTTMQMLTANLTPAIGEIHIAGIDLLEYPKRAKAMLGYLPDTPPLYKEMRVDEYLYYCARIQRIAATRITSAIDLAKQRCGLTDVGKKLINQLSKGYQQRVGIAQAIIHTPPVVILDEPTVGLDPIQIHDIRNMIRDLAKEHSVILSTHILPEVQAVCDRVQIIHQGELVLNESIDALEQHLQSTVLLLALANPPEIEYLKTLPGIIEINQQDDQHFLVHYQADNNPTQRLLHHAVQKDWGLYELTPQKLSLENIFMSLTLQEQDRHPSQESVA